VPTHEPPLIKNISPTQAPAPEHFTPAHLVAGVPCVERKGASMGQKQLNDGRYQVDIRDANDNRLIRIFESEEDAKLFESDIIKTLPPKGQRKRHKKQNRCTVEQFILQVIADEEQLLEKDEAKHGTILRWKSNLALFPDWLKTKLVI
jgi:hypothetical protein